MGSITSCGVLTGFDHQEKGVGYTRQFTTTENGFLSYIVTFENHAKTELNNPSFVVADIPINFGDTENTSYVGVCFSYSNGDKEIIIDKEWWDSVSPTSRESLIFHELGHCALNRVHNEEEIVKSGKTVRSSIMHPGVVSAIDYNTYKPGYLHELYTSDQSILFDSI
ncbi:MAG: hypothetical protein HN576_04810 [Bacteriovoracaceae bacterium]|jgi:hypothetical protein|nr:hypothetical protein [Bacteriovoracaceae bacterium]